MLNRDTLDGAALARRLSARVEAPLTRFAPAPTGFLHIGHVVNAIFVWGLARAMGGRVLLRIEDHDRQRCRPEYEQALVDDLDWLGFEPDVYPTAAFRAGACEGRQRDRDEIYRTALAPLVAAGLVYGCDCSRAQIGDTGRRASNVGSRASTHDSRPPTPESRPATSDSRPPTTDSRPPAELPYSGRCRDRGLPLTDGVGWRIRIAPGVERFEDGMRGPLEQDPASQCGDLLVRDRLGNWTYQWAAATDDTVQRITLIVRGEDLIESTGRQLRLARLLGRPAPPVFAHHPLVMKSPTQKVSKSDRDTGVRDLRAAGWAPAGVIGQAAVLAGLRSEAGPLEADAVPQLFRESTR